MTTSNEAIAAAREIYEYVCSGFPKPVSTRNIEAIIQKHYAVEIENEAEIKGMPYPEVEAERDQLKARVAELEKALQRLIDVRRELGNPSVTPLAKKRFYEIEQILKLPSSALTRLQELERKEKALDWLLDSKACSTTKYVNTGPKVGFLTTHFVDLNSIESAMEKQK